MRIPTPTQTRTWVGGAPVLNVVHARQLGGLLNPKHAQVRQHAEGQQRPRRRPAANHHDACAGSSRNAHARERRGETSSEQLASAAATPRLLSSRLLANCAAAAALTATPMASCGRGHNQFAATHLAPAHAPVVPLPSQRTTPPHPQAAPHRAAART